MSKHEVKSITVVRDGVEEKLEGARAMQFLSAVAALAEAEKRKALTSPDPRA